MRQTVVSEDYNSVTTIVKIATQNCCMALSVDDTLRDIPTTVAEHTEFYQRSIRQHKQVNNKQHH